jgi:hypothetical protein
MMSSERASVFDQGPDRIQAENGNQASRSTGAGEGSLGECQFSKPRADPHTSPGRYPNHARTKAAPDRSQYPAQHQGAR